MKNKKANSGIIVLAVLLIVVLGGWYLYNYNPTMPTQNITIPVGTEPTTIPNTGDITIANWNLQIFGDSKASDSATMVKIANEIGKYDIVFVQEIRDEDGSAFGVLCSMLSNYECKNSSRAGRSTSKEQYGIIYKKGLNFVSMVDYNPDSQDRWERPPILFTFNLNGKEVEIYNIHVKPEDVNNELTNLQTIAENDGDEIILGDFNSDCSYFEHASSGVFNTWTWVIGDEKDTTSGSSDCAYDRIIMNFPYKDYGIDTSGGDVSDHFLVWIKI